MKVALAKSTDVSAKDDAELVRDSLVSVGRLRRHEQAPVEYFVPVSVVGQARKFAAVP